MLWSGGPLEFPGCAHPVLIPALGTSYLLSSAVPAAPSAAPTRWEGCVPASEPGWLRVSRDTGRHRHAPYKTDLRSGLYLLLATGGCAGQSLKCPSLWVPFYLL